MCGIAGIIATKGNPIPELQSKLTVMEQLLAHRGPDGVGLWTNEQQTVGLAHRRLSIIDLSKSADQPMVGEDGNVLVFNGEIYNYHELRQKLANRWSFKTHSDSEVILAAYNQYRLNSLDLLRGMFAFAIWNERQQEFFAARDLFGIKPFYYILEDDYFIFASEVKALLPFIDSEIDPLGFSEYLTFQAPIGSNTLFKNIRQLLPAHCITIRNGRFNIARYWDLESDNKFENNIESQLENIFEESVASHLVSDTPIGCYLSGGIDSSLIAAIASKAVTKIPCFHGKFSHGPNYDESPYAKLVAEQCGGTLHISDMTADDFVQNIERIIYYLDYPVAGPGAFPQYLVSKNASQHVKVLLAGQGADELFGGYARYFIAYLEQCLKAALNGTYHDDHFEINFENLLHQLAGLKSYQPLIKQFWSNGLFDDFDQRYYRLIDRSADISDEINWLLVDKEHTFHDFQRCFNPADKNLSFFDRMLRFDFKYLLPGLLHVEDRMSMAHGVESRVPFLDRKLVEFVSAVPAREKFKNGELKSLLRNTFGKYLPMEVTKRQDKMGFPVPLNEWMAVKLRDYLQDIFATGKNKQRAYINYDIVIQHLDSTGIYSRKLWAFLSLELWQQQFFDQRQTTLSIFENQLEVF